MQLRWCWLVSVLGLLGAAEGARILAFLPFPARSHQAVFGPVIRELAARGHQVTAITPLKLSDPPPTYKEILIPDLLADLLKSVDVSTFGQKGVIGETMTLYGMGIYFQGKVCELPEVQKLIHSKDLQFDAVILESMFVQETFSAFLHKFNAVGIELMPLGNNAWVNHLVGSPFNPAYMVDFKSKATDSMSYIERVKNTAIYLVSIAIGEYYFMPKYQVIMDKYFNYTGWESRPPIMELLSQKSLVLQNSHFSTNYAYPQAPHIIDVGGLNVHPKNSPLPKDIQTFMDEAEDGVIYFSLGSNLKVSDVAKGNKLESLLKAFGKLKQRVLWKWEVQDMPGKPANVKTSKWFPQQDILAHKKCKLFITHGGYLSIAEAITYGVPMIGVPFFGDQPKNMKQVVHAGYGLQLDFDNITEESLTWAINEHLTNPSYKEAVTLKSVIYKDRPMSALDTAVYWVEYVIKFKGAPHLRPALAGMPCYKAMLLDVSLVFLLPPFVVLLLSYLMISKLVGIVFGNKKAPTKSQEQKSKKKMN